MEDFGEPARIRTVDILIKSEALYQLSYGLVSSNQRSITGAMNRERCAVGQAMIVALLILFFMFA